VSYALAGILGWFVSPYIAIALFLWMIIYHTVTSEGLHTNPVARWLAPPGARRGHAGGVRTGDAGR
jgi:hypothetical protein